jgi:hypothetical protein
VLDTLEIKKHFSTQNDILWATIFNIQSLFQKNLVCKLRIRIFKQPSMEAEETFDILSDQGRTRKNTDNQLSSTIESDYIYHQAGLTYSYR